MECPAEWASAPTRRGMMNENELELIHIIRESKDPTAVLEFALRLVIADLQTHEPCQGSVSDDPAVPA